MDASTETESRPATVNITSHVTEIDGRHVWTDDHGVTHGSLHLGPSWIVFHDPAQAREVAALLGQMAEAMAAQIARAALAAPAAA
jgi:hypothetical protein